MAEVIERVLRDSEAGRVPGTEALDQGGLTNESSLLSDLSSTSIANGSPSSKLGKAISTAKGLLPSLRRKSVRASEHLDHHQPR